MRREREIDLDQFIQHYHHKDIIILDVRESWEKPYILSDKVIQIPINRIVASVDQIPRDEDVIVICQHAVRSSQVVQYLETQHNFTNLINLAGGVSTYTADEG